MGHRASNVRELIRKDQDRQRLRNLLLEGVSAASGPVADRAYLEGSRARVRRHADREGSGSKRDQA